MVIAAPAVDPAATLLFLWDDRLDDDVVWVVVADPSVAAEGIAVAEDREGLEGRWDSAKVETTGVDVFEPRPLDVTLCGIGEYAALTDASWGSCLVFVAATVVVPSVEMVREDSRCAPRSPGLVITMESALSSILVTTPSLEEAVVAMAEAEAESEAAGGEEGAGTGVDSTLGPDEDGSLDGACLVSKVPLSAMDSRLEWWSGGNSPGPRDVLEFVR